MTQHAGNFQLGGQGAGMLPAGAAKRHQPIAARIVSLGQRDRANRLGHVGVGQPNKTFGQVLERKRLAGGGQLCRDFAQAALDRLAREEEGKMIGRNPAQKEIDVGDRQRSAATIAGRPRIGARRCRARRPASRRRNGRSSRRRPPRFRSPASGPPAARRPFRFRTPIRNCHRNGKRRCWCHPCRSRSPAVHRPPGRCAKSRPRRRPAPTKCCPCRQTARRRPGRRPRSESAPRSRAGPGAGRRRTAARRDSSRHRQWSCRHAAPA